MTAARESIPELTNKPLRLSTIRRAPAMADTTAMHTFIRRTWPGTVSLIAVCSLLGWFSPLGRGAIAAAAYGLAALLVTPPLWWRVVSGNRKPTAARGAVAGAISGALIGCLTPGLPALAILLLAGARVPDGFASTMLSVIAIGYVVVGIPVGALFGAVVGGIAAEYQSHCSERSVPFPGPKTRWAPEVAPPARSTRQ